EAARRTKSPEFRAPAGRRTSSLYDTTFAHATLVRASPSPKRAHVLSRHFPAVLLPGAVARQRCRLDHDERLGRLFADRSKSAGHARRHDLRAGFGRLDAAVLAVDGQSRTPNRLHDRG